MVLAVVVVVYIEGVPSCIMVGYRAPICDGRDPFVSNFADEYMGHLSCHVDRPCTRTCRNNDDKIVILYWLRSEGCDTIAWIGTTMNSREGRGYTRRQILPSFESCAIILFRRGHVHDQSVGPSHVTHYNMHFWWCVVCHVYDCTKYLL